jgi:hypothetical protein
MIGASELNDVALKDGELMLDPDVDGIDASLMLSTNKDSIACDDCDKWTHRQCIGMSTTEFSKLGNSEETWTCPSCLKPNNSSTILYTVPCNGDSKHSSVNISTNPLLVDSISEASILHPSMQHHLAQTHLS